MEFDKASSSSVAASDLAHRYLWNPQATDQLLADEQVTSLSSAGTRYWAMTDDQGSVAEVIDSSGKLRIQNAFDSFGNVRDTHYDSSGTWVSSGTSGYIDEAFEYTGRWTDKATGLQNNLNRWYDPSIGRWISRDPIGFKGDPSNLYRYVGNAPTTLRDPSGLAFIPGNPPEKPPGNGDGGGIGGAPSEVAQAVAPEAVAFRPFRPFRGVQRSVIHPGQAEMLRGAIHLAITDRIRAATKATMTPARLALSHIIHTTIHTAVNTGWVHWVQVPRIHLDHERHADI